MLIAVLPYSFIFFLKLHHTLFISWALWHLFYKFFYTLSQEIAIISVLKIRKMRKNYFVIHWGHAIEQRRTELKQIFMGPSLRLFLSLCGFLYIYLHTYCKNKYFVLIYTKVTSSCWGRGRFLFHYLIRVWWERKFVLIRKKIIRYINHSYSPIKHST